MHAIVLLALLRARPPSRHDRRGGCDRTPAPPPALARRRLLESFGVRVRVVGRPDVPVIILRREDKAGTTVELDLVGGEDAGLPVRLAKVMLHDCPF